MKTVEENDKVPFNNPNAISTGTQGCFNIIWIVIIIGIILYFVL